MIKRIICAAFCLIMILCTAACGEKPAEVRDISMYDLSRVMLAADEFGDMSYASSADDGAEDLLANVSDIDYAKVLSFFIAYASDGMGNADEIVVIATRDTADVSEAQTTLQKHLEYRRSVYATYDPTQLDKLDRGTVFSQDNLAVLIVSGDNAKVRTAFEEFIAK